MMTNPEYLEAYTEEMLLAQYEAALASTSDVWELV